MYSRCFGEERFIIYSSPAPAKNPEPKARL
jgi:hypothetical protein